MAEGKEAKVMKEGKETKVVEEMGVLPSPEGKNINVWWLIFGALMLGNLATR